MPFLTVKVETPHASNVPRDAVVNTFAIIPKGSADRTAAATAFTLSLKAMYTYIGTYLSSVYQWDKMTAEYVDLTDAHPRTPFKTDLVAPTLASTGLYDMPAELAICVSYQGATGSGVNIRRRRGRVYIGPLQVTGGIDFPDVLSAMRTGVATGFGPIMVDPNYELCVYSRYTHYSVPVGRNILEENDSGEKIFVEHPELLGGAFTPVVTAWIDNAWDIQRRRGTRATTRTLLTPS